MQKWEHVRACKWIHEFQIHLNLLVLRRIPNEGKMRFRPAIFIPFVFRHFPLEWYKNIIEQQKGI
jgi:hypothetical protein